MPRAVSLLSFPVRTTWSSCPHGSQWHAAVRVAAIPRSDPGTSDRSVDPNEVNKNVSAGPVERMSMLAAARNRLDTAPGSQSSSAARSTALSGPADKRSGMPSRARVPAIWLAQYPLMIPYIRLVSSGAPGSQTFSVLFALSMARFPPLLQGGQESRRAGRACPGNSTATVPAAALNLTFSC